VILAYDKTRTERGWRASGSSVAGVHRDRRTPGLMSAIPMRSQDQARIPMNERHLVAFTRARRSRGPHPRVLTPRAATRHGHQHKRPHERTGDAGCRADAHGRTMTVGTSPYTARDPIETHSSAAVGWRSAAASTDAGHTVRAHRVASGEPWVAGPTIWVPGRVAASACFALSRGRDSVSARTRSLSHATTPRARRADHPHPVLRAAPSPQSGSSRGHR
jgi:hypothetical protein